MKKIKYILFVGLVAISCNNQNIKKMESNFILLNQYVVSKNDNPVERYFDLNTIKLPAERRKSSPDLFDEFQKQRKLLQNNFYIQILTSADISDTLVQNVVKEIIYTECNYSVEEDSLHGYVDYTESGKMDVKIVLKQYSQSFIQKNFSEKFEKELVDLVNKSGTESNNNQFFSKYNLLKEAAENIYLFGIGNEVNDSSFIREIVLFDL